MPFNPKTIKLERTIYGRGKTQAQTTTFECGNFWNAQDWRDAIAYAVKTSGLTAKEIKVRVEAAPSYYDSVETTVSISWTDKKIDPVALREYKAEQEYDKKCYEERERQQYEALKAKFGD